MITHDNWTELLTCSNCGMSGSAHLSQPEKRAYDFSVEAIPAGFKVAPGIWRDLLLRSLQSTGAHQIAGYCAARPPQWAASVVRANGPSSGGEAGAI
jgi:hypothetical protein